ncbi:MAG: PBECR2 nuclease fold domain-containing protein [Cohaesibacter sp.]|nr:PBECR2 nuclease fold domain-containing protein [Cohaesibacter sp.]MCV6603118.1 PBECR2 nuclease fold domain-containing protein [Cohaesibacter sp.]
MELPGLDPLVPLKDFAVPSKKPKMQRDLPEQDYVDAFLGEFGASSDAPELFRDAVGHVVVVSDDLFRAFDGSSKLVIKAGAVEKLNNSRATSMLQLADALRNPDEIWVDWEWHEAAKRWILRRRYLKSLNDLAGLIIFEAGPAGWRGTTVYNAETGRKTKRKPNYNQLEMWRRGALLFRRGEIRQ